MLCVDARRMGRAQDHHKHGDRMCFAGILRDSFDVLMDDCQYTVRRVQHDTYWVKTD